MNKEKRALFLCPYEKRVLSETLFLDMFLEASIILGVLVTALKLNAVIMFMGS